MQLAYTLGEWDDARAGDALGQLALRDAGDRYLTAAVMSSVNRKNLDRVLLTVMKGGEKRRLRRLWWKACSAWRTPWATAERWSRC